MTDDRTRPGFLTRLRDRLAAWFPGPEPERCPSCGQPALRSVQWIRATVLVDGKRAPASWLYFVCESCSGRFRRDIRGGAFTVPSEQEWQTYCRFGC
jgi:hypothetical protein